MEIVYNGDALLNLLKNLLNCSMKFFHDTHFYVFSPVFIPLQSLRGSTKQIRKGAYIIYEHLYHKHLYQYMGLLIRRNVIQYINIHIPTPLEVSISQSISQYVATLWKGALSRSCTVCAHDIRNLDESDLFEEISGKTLRR